MKTVGIILREVRRENIDYVGVRKDLYETVKSFNVNIIGIPISNDFDSIKKLVDLCDGIVLPGGNKCVDNDFLLVEYLYKNDIPTLGICLGMQAMGMYFNDRVEGHLKNHNSNEEYVHSVSINKDSLLYKILQKEKIEVNSRHNDYIPFTNIDVNALSEDNIIEGVEDKTKRFFLGLQWHPESIPDENSYAIFKSFIDSL